MQELGLIAWPFCRCNQNIYGIDLPIDRAGRYVIIFEYYGGGPGQNSGLRRHGSQDAQQGELIFNDYSFLHRPCHRYPRESFSYDFVAPTLECVRTADGEVLLLSVFPSTYPVPPNTILLDGGERIPKCAPTTKTFHGPSPGRLSTSQMIMRYFQCEILPHVSGAVSPSPNPTPATPSNSATSAKASGHAAGWRRRPAVDNTMPLSMVQSKLFIFSVINDVKISYLTYHTVLASIAHAPWHKSTGQCYCKGQVSGRTCDECRDGTYRLDASNPIGCQDCNCDVGGSVHAACNKETGQCVCRPRVTGVTCDMPEANHFVPDLHQMKFEAEDGYTPNGRRVRFGYDGFEFPGFSYLGYAIMSAIQPEIRIPVTVESPSIYRIILRYYYPNAGGPTRGRMTVTPADSSQVQASEQSSGIIFVSTVNPQFVTVEGSGVIKPFVLNPGSWIVAIEAPEGILIDYLVLLPSDFYEATILQEHTTEPCIVGTPQQRCNFYVFPEVDQFYVAPGVDGYSVDGGGGRYPVQRFGDDLIMQELGLDSMALVDVNQNIYGIDLPIDRAGRYVIIFEYYGGGPGQNSGLLDVYGSQDTQQGELIFNDCSFLCRAIVLDDDNRVKVFDIQEVMPYAQLTKIGSPYMLSISRVIAIPVESFSYDFVTPTLECVRTADGECLPSTYPVPPNTILLDGETDPNVPLPPNIHNPSPTVIYLSNDNENTASYDDDLVPNSGEVVFVIHYYQPDGQSYDANFRVVGQFDGEGTFNAKYCPHVSGCRVVVTKPDGSNVFELSDLSQGIQVTLPDGGDRQLWIDDIMIIPVEMYTPDLINANPQDRAGEFIQYCSANDFYFSPESSGFCREAVFSLSSAFNYGASECDCDSQGSLSFNCDELGGQCQCRQNIVGRRCNKCAVGYYDFPYCRACTCQSGVCNEVSGECICPENVAGANCDTCAPQTYGYHPIVGCVDCECDIRGVDNDDLNCDFFTGQCNCKPNIGGRQCERCERGYYGYPYCEPCNCDVNGTTEEICDQTTAQCLCKDNVYGDQCNQCEPGTFYLADSNPEGCISCFCFGVSSDCQSYTRRRAKIDMVDGWTTVNFDPSQIQYGSNFANIYVSGTGDDPQSAIYWSASDKFIGNKLTSYGGKLEYTVRNNPQPAIGVDGPAQPMRRPDILISGNNISIMYLHINQPEPGQDLSVSVELKENNFQYSISAAEVSRSDFMTVLANIDSLQIRAQYYDRILTADLVGVSMDTTKRNGDGAVAQEVERCRCPPQYQGLSCEQCAEGHYRLPGSGPYLGQCVPCNCNGHASQCDPKTGQCLNCQHNTEGDQCERCKNGYYGDAPSGEPDACKICSCPQPVENLNFAQTCTFSPEGEQFCICQPGHTGQYCDQCVEGYYGNPYQGQACRRCDCSGNTDPNTGLSECDQSSGNCTSCRVETKGRRCEDCNDWFYGDARVQNCQACSCDQCGSESCDHLNGVCNCRPNVVGYDCERCAVGYWNYHSCSGCLACDCAVGAIDSQCDMETGQCTCMPGVGGEKCDACLHGYWNYGPNGCYECGCDPKLRCDPNTGECLCPPGAMGENCDECEDRYILTEQGCQPCDECVHLLLDIVEEMAGDLDEADRNLTGITVGVVAFQRLNQLNESIHDLIVRHYSSIIYALMNVTDLAVTTDPDDPPSAVMFDGTGYAIVPRGTKEMAVGNRIQMQIKTLSPNGLLLFAGNEGETFFVEMRGGRIYYEYDLGSGPVSKRSKNMYNNNEWTTINLFRAGQATQLFTISQGTITEDFASFSSPGAETELATNDLIYIGGLVAIPDGQFPTVTRERFRGCMANLVISSQNVDLTAADVQTAGFFPACIRQDIRVATYPRPSGGYTELAMLDGLDLMRDGDFILRFRTEEPDGLMLYTADDTQSSSVAIMMSNGAVLVVAHKDGSTAELLTPENTYSDGMWHTINVRRPARRANRELSLSVDDNGPVLEAFNSRGMKTAGMLFVGGVPEGYDLGPITVPPAANAPFIGCLADISSKYEKITFANRMRHFNAFYGFCDPLLSSNATEDEATLTSPAPTDAASTEGASTPPSMRNDGPCVLSSNPEEAPEDPSNEGAVQFGVLADSHVAFPRQVKQYKYSYNISVAVRTGARNGLMYYAADDSQIDILTLFLYEGRPVMVFNLGSGNLRLEPEDGRTINDAQWHTIRTYRKRTEGELYIDGELVASGNSGPGARLLQTTSPFFWGGLNRTLTISNNDVNEASQIGLLGCMKDLANDGVPFGTPSSEYEIQACSQLIEPGVYFGPGKGYVIPDETFGVNQRMEVRMSIKPRVKSGVIFSVAKPQMDFASLELIDGQLFFRVQNGAGVIEATYMPPEGSAFLCDGNWHDLLVTKEGSLLQITVDGDEGELVTGPSGATAANTNDPLYFGGLPDGEEGNHPGIVVNAHYVGCMRDIMVNDDLINMSAGLFEGDVDTRSCAAN
nr:laminin-like protein epi-1 [Lytechinus pictus]